jgi:hypothetical protein
MGNSTPDLPELVFVPAHPQVRSGEQDVVLEVRATADGKRMLPVFTSTEALVAALGPMQPWAKLPLESARRLMGEAGVDLVVVDPPAQADAVRWAEGDIDALRRSE